MPSNVSVDKDNIISLTFHLRDTYRKIFYKVGQIDLNNLIQFFICFLLLFIGFM